MVLKNFDSIIIELFNRPWLVAFSYHFLNFHPKETYFHSLALKDWFSSFDMSRKFRSRYLKRLNFDNNDAVILLYSSKADTVQLICIRPFSSTNEYMQR